MTTETRFHRHWYVNVSTETAVYRWLRKPRWWSTDRTKVEASIFAWGIYRDGFGLSILGVLHGLTGLTLRYEDEG